MRLIAACVHHSNTLCPPVKHDIAAAGLADPACLPLPASPPPSAPSPPQIALIVHQGLEGLSLGAVLAVTQFSILKKVRGVDGSAGARVCTLVRSLRGSW